MKGMTEGMIIAIILAVLSVLAMFVYWEYTKTATTRNPLTAMFGLALFGAIRKKGIVLTTTLLATVVLVIIVVFVLFLIFASLGAEAGPSSNSLFYNFFDAILRSLPWVK